MVRLIKEGKEIPSFRAEVSSVIDWSIVDELSDIFEEVKSKFGPRKYKEDVSKSFKYKYGEYKVNIFGRIGGLPDRRSDYITVEYYKKYSWSRHYGIPAYRDDYELSNRFTIYVRNKSVVNSGSDEWKYSSSLETAEELINFAIKDYTNFLKNKFNV